MTASGDNADDGFSLVELLVAMVLFAGLLAIFGTSITIMFKDVRHQLGQSDDLDATRRVLSDFDRNARYANAINTPGTTGSGSTLTYWVEWRSGNQGQQQTCTQWRLSPTGDMQYRTWLPSLSSGGSVTGPTAWRTRASHVSAPTSGGPFSFPAASVLATTSRQQLIVSFITTYGAPPVSSPSTLTITALNTTASAALLTPVCQEVGRT